MYKLSIKIEDPGSREYQMAYQMMHDIFDDLVFCGNIAGHAIAGTEAVIFDCERDAIKAAAEEAWRNDRDMLQPDDLLKIEWVSGWDGEGDTHTKKVELTREDMVVIAASLSDHAGTLKNTAMVLDDNRDYESAELCRKTARQCNEALQKVLKNMNPES